jgi:leader peptidase (prepilin peptidase) / N-methyltransferase
MGLVLGSAVAPALLIALLTGSVVGIGVMTRRGVSQGRRTAIPFGPFLALGGMVALFAGPAMVNLYLHGVRL